VPPDASLRQQEVQPGPGAVPEVRQVWHAQGANCAAGAESIEIRLEVIAIEAISAQMASAGARDP